MARALAKSTRQRLRRALDEQLERLQATLHDLLEEQEAVRLTETASDRSPDPNTAEGGSMAYELEKGLSIAENTRDLIAQVEHALGRMEAGTYGLCEVCGDKIPVARLQALPYTTRCVTCASKR